MGPGNHLLKHSPRAVCRLVFTHFGIYIYKYGPSLISAMTVTQRSVGACGWALLCISPLLRGLQPGSEAALWLRLLTLL